MKKLLATEPVLFLNALGAVIALAISAGIISQANGDTLTQMAGVAIPVILTLVSSFLARARVTPVTA